MELEDNSVKDEATITSIKAIKEAIITSIKAIKENLTDPSTWTLEAISYGILMETQLI